MSSGSVLPLTVREIHLANIHFPRTSASLADASTEMQHDLSGSPRDLHPRSNFDNDFLGQHTNISMHLNERNTMTSKYLTSFHSSTVICKETFLSKRSILTYLDLYGLTSLT